MIKKYKLKIGFFAPAVLENGGGLEKYLIETAGRLSSSKIKADVITMDAGFTLKLAFLLQIFYLKKITRADLFKEKTSSIIRKLGKANYIKCKTFPELIKLFSNYDVIYSKNEIFEAFIFKFILGYNNIPPVVFGCHSSFYYPSVKSLRFKLRNFLYNSFIYKYLTAEVKGFHVINSSDEQHLRKLFPDKLISKIYNPFDFEAFSREGKLDDDYRFNKHKTNILWVGNLTELKGVDDLIKIIDFVNGSNYEGKIDWNICGEGPEKNKILNLEKKWQNVKYFGFIENRHISDIYKSNQLFINTSISECFPYTLLEAQSVGLPVIAYNIGGCNDIIDNGINGILAEDWEQLAEKILQFVDGEYKFQNIGKYIAKKFNSDLIYKQLISFFENSLKE